jgi:hypothetical protein
MGRRCAGSSPPDPPRRDFGVSTEVVRVERPRQESPEAGGHKPKEALQTTSPRKARQAPSSETLGTDHIVTTESALKGTPPSNGRNDPESNKPKSPRDPSNQLPNGGEFIQSDSLLKPGDEA